MKQRTIYKFLRICPKNTFLRTGLVHNINTKNHKPFDVIRLQFKSVTDEGDFFMKPSEALGWVYGLTNALERWFEKEDIGRET